MYVSHEYAYFLGCLVFLCVWLILFLHRKDLRKEMLVVSFLIGAVSVVTAHYWWTVDWWHPLTITGTRVGVEDFISGFAGGGIMAVLYEEIFKKRYYKRKLHHHYPGAFTILLLLAQLTGWLFWGVGLTSFYASTLTMVIVAAVMFYFRHDLIANGVLSGTLMALVSIPMYWTIMAFSPGWVEATYDMRYLSGFLPLGIPIEELVFWFLAGLVFGPFYEYWKGERLRKVRST